MESVQNKHEYVLYVVIYRDYPFHYRMVWVPMDPLSKHRCHGVIPGTTMVGEYEDEFHMLYDGIRRVHVYKHNIGRLTDYFCNGGDYAYGVFRGKDAVKQARKAVGEWVESRIKEVRMFQESALARLDQLVLESRPAYDEERISVELGRMLGESKMVDE